MKILVDINHPGHVHFFKHLIRAAKSSGHEVVVVASEKDQTTLLLEEYKIPFIRIGGYGKGLLRKLFNLFYLNLRILLIVLRHKPDILVGIASFRCAQIGFLTGRRTLIFDDTEHSKFEIGMYKPFASAIFTPSSFSDNLGEKQIRYNSYHELAYLHPARFTPDGRVLDEVGIAPGEKFFVLRFVSWNAGHDMGQKGLSLSAKRRLVHLLERHGRVLITSEGGLPDELARYRASISPGMIHHLLSFAHIYVGEGGTMATESAILGTPAVLINPLRAGNFDELRDKYQLLQQFDNIDQAYPTIETLVNTHDLKERWGGKRKILLRDKMDASAFIIETVLPSSKTAEDEDSSESPRLTASLD